MTYPIHRWRLSNPSALRDWQFRRLRRYLTKTVVPHSPYYRTLFEDLGIEPTALHSWESFANLPMTRKRDLTATEDEPDKPRRFILQPDADALRRSPQALLRAIAAGRGNIRSAFEDEFRPVLMTSTTGRSADPVPFVYTKHDLHNLETTGRRMMEICGSRRAFRHLNLFPYAPHLAFWQTHYAGVGFTTFCVGSGGGKVMGTAGNLKLISRIKPHALIGMPTFLYHLLSIACEEGIRIPSIKRVVLGGEALSDGMRGKLADLCREVGADSPIILGTYGFTEAKMAWPECPTTADEPPSGYHLSPDLGVVEIVDPTTGEPVPDEEPGEIVFTPLDSRGSVVVRYRTGDLIDGGITYQRCPHCGRCAPRLLGKISRVSDIRRLRVEKVKGTLVDFNALEHVLDSVPGLGSWQIQLRKRNDDPLETDEVIVLATIDGHRSAEDLIIGIRETMFSTTEIRPNAVRFVPPEEIRELQGVGVELKEKKIADLRGTASPGRRPTTHHPQPELVP